jgi:predicted transposase YbfD/YdcC
MKLIYTLVVDYILVQSPTTQFHVRSSELKRRIHRKGKKGKKGKKTTEIVYLISSLTIEQFNARGLLQLKRGYWVIESRLHHTLDVTLSEDFSRVRQPNAALVLAMFRRLTVSLAIEWLQSARLVKPRASARSFQKQFHHRDGGVQRLEALIFAKSPTAWRLPS